jgi:hypothetical protein
MAGVIVIAVAGCGDDGPSSTVDAPPDDAPVDATAIDARIDSATPVVVGEPPDCGGDPLVARGGDLSLVVSSMVIATLDEGYDLDNDAMPDNKLAAIASLSQTAIADALVAGTLVVPVEIFDRGANPDACVKLGLYAGACVGPCDLTDATPDTVTIDPASLGTGDVPISRLRSMSTDAAGTITSLGGFLQVSIPITDAITMALPITVVHAGGILGATTVSGFRYGGTMQAHRLDEIAAPIIEEIGTGPGDTELDMFFANLLGPLVALPRSMDPSAPMGCRTPDIDNDGDGLESFCDTNPDDAEKRVDMCIDGDGTVIMDGDDLLPDCTQHTIGGVPRFTDGISGALVFSTSPATIQ